MRIATKRNASLGLGVASFLALLSAETLASAERMQFPICGAGKRVTCVVDGDTIWLRGEKIRLEAIDAPEVGQPRCPHEAALGKKATRELQRILNDHSFSVRRNGKDRYRRTLARLQIGGTTAGQMLIERGLAKRWKGRKVQWC